MIDFTKKDGRVFFEVVIYQTQNFSPKLSSKVLPVGSIFYPEIDDMYPFLEREEYDAIEIVF